MSIGSVSGFRDSWRYPEEEGFDPELAAINPFKLDDLDSIASNSSDADYNSGSESDESDVSDEEIARAEQADKDYFNPGLYSRFKDKIPANSLTIGLMAICFASALYFNSLPSEDQAKVAGFEEGSSESMSAVRNALTYVETYSGQKITELFTQYVNTK